MIGRLVEQEQIRSGDEGLAEQRAAPPPSGQLTHATVGRQIEARDDELHLLFQPPAVALLELVLEPAEPLECRGTRVGRQRRPVIRGYQRSQLAEAIGHFVEHGSIAFARNILLEPRDPQAWCAPDDATVRFDLSRDHPQQGRLAGPVPPDETDAFARFDPEIGAIQQRQVAEGEG